MALPQDKLTVGISACLVGQAVRYDGGHKLQPLITNVLAGHAQLLPFCPELAAGLGVPRPPVQLISSSRGKRARGVEDQNLDVTSALVKAATAYCDGLDELSLSGFVLKSRSPSCGLGSTPVYSETANLIDHGTGLFAEQLRIAAPWLPCVEEAWLLSRPRCWRFLTACAITARSRYGQSAHLELIQELKEKLQLNEGSLIEFMLNDDSMLEMKAALDERLERYWSQYLENA